ncbi:DUF4192 domain-containing protein [Nocardia brasiliensis]|uniref:DUF4192 domain-containing protein n=1 Tax=Nocardia brasiliensis TaxID=37326 RepID=UPI00379D405D
MGVRPHPTIYLAPGHSDKLWANKIRTRLLGGGARSKKYTAALAATLARNERANENSIASMSEQVEATADDMPRSGLAESDSVVGVHDPGELIAGIPAMIGFVPEDSLVVLVLRPVPERRQQAIIDAVMRLDLNQPGGGRLRADTVARCVSQVAARIQVAAVLALVLDERGEDSKVDFDGGGRAYSTAPSDLLVRDLAEHLAGQNTVLAGAWAARTIAPKQPWHSLIGPAQQGVLPDPADTALTKEHVGNGETIHSSRAGLTELVTEDLQLQHEVAALLDTTVTSARDRHRAAVLRGDPDVYRRQALEYVLWQIASVECGEQPGAPELAELAAALRDRLVRDALLATAVGEHARAAEVLWSTMTRALSGRDRAEAAALLAYSAYTRGDGPLAGIALEAALQADPDHGLACLLETALTLGMRPDDIRRLARSGYQAAADLGFDLGGPTIIPPTEGSSEQL